MRKLMIASQKGGVGKTTTALNLAVVASEHGHRVLLLDTDPLGGISAALAVDPENRGTVAGRWSAWPSALPNIDVISIAAGEVPAVEDWKALFRQLSAPGYHQRYDLTIIDTPPGLQFVSLLSSCDDVLLVMRAETLAYRTLPTALRELRKSQQAGGAPKFHGILLTLPLGEVAGGQAEAEWREQLGSVLMLDSMPYDPAVALGALRCRPVVLDQPTSPACRRYRELAAALELVPATAALFPPTPFVVPGQSRLDAPIWDKPDEGDENIQRTRQHRAHQGNGNGSRVNQQG